MSGRAAPALFVIGHGTRSEAGVAEFWRFADLVADAAPTLDTGAGFIEFAEPDLDAGLDALVAKGVDDVIAVPLVLLGAGHAKNDGPAALDRARHRHPGVRFRYAGALGIHPALLEVAEERARAALGELGSHANADETAVVLVGRGSSDPDANSDLYKVARLLQDRRGLGIVEPAFVSLAPPDVTGALERCRRLGATSIVTVPYFLFTGVLVDRIADQARAWAAEHPDARVGVGTHLGADARLARLVVERYRGADEGVAQVNCDCCVYRVALPGYADRVGAAVVAHDHVHDHRHAHDDEA